MNPRPLYARLAAEVLAADLEPGIERSPGDDAVPFSISDAERERAIAAVSMAMDARRARRRRVRRLWVSLSLAASVLLVLGAVHALTGPGFSNRGTGFPDKAVVLQGHIPAGVDPMATPLDGEVRVGTEGGASHAISAGTRLAVGEHVLADPQGHARVTLSTGTRLSLEPASDLAVTEASPALTIFTLARGAVRADVAKLEAGARFLVRTPDAEVEVRGTSFRVSVGSPVDVCNGTSITRVEVTEGTVTTRHGNEEIALRPGESWTTPCTDEAPKPAPNPAKASPPSVPPRSHAAPPTHSDGALSPPLPSMSSAPAPTVATERAVSDLAAQNDLFAEAMREKQRGDAKAAVATLDRFATTYPASPLLESAVAERMKILATADPVRARTAAREYLARFPRGFARGDAEKILATGP